MSHPAPLARGLLATTLLAACCLASEVHGQYATTQPYPQQIQRGYSGLTAETTPQAYPSTSAGVVPASAYSGSTYGGSAYGGGTAPRYRVAQALESSPAAPQSSPSDMPLPPVGDNGEYVAPSQNGYPQTGANGHYGGYQPYAHYNPSCNCLDGGTSTWGMWSGYQVTSPCRGGAGGCNIGTGGLFHGAGCNTCGPAGGGAVRGCTGCTGCANGCASCQISCVAPCRVWFGGVYGLFMDRDDENVAWTSYDSSNIANQVLNSRDASIDWQPGNEIRFGSTFVCHPWAWEVVYWALYDETDEWTVTSADLGALVRTTYDFGGLDYDDGGGVSGVNSFFDDAGGGGVEAHRVRRSFEVQNLEINMIYFPLMQAVGPYGVSRGGGGWSAGCNRFSVVGTAGFRYFRADDFFQFATSPSDFVFGNAAEDMFYDIDVENHLFGLQVGAASNYQVGPKFAFYADGRFGVFANYIEHVQQIYGSNGFAVVTGGLPFAGQAYNIQSNKTDVSFLGEVRIGGALQVRPHWRLYGGWRAIGITGYAHPTEQIPQYFAGIPDIADIDSNGSLILHGLEAGVEVAY